ncbi:MAG TPA: hypothetical protein PK668_12225 [Myxococcota bacterium]|nr:hypothetical protein [Myxococcota bacterium]HRY93765.1 hypothetical protein [Myxococcota bacterium]HSA21022.1 hypothetical protein [Myxococcota bacterium]
MSKCDLSIQLDTPVVRLGEELRGSVLVSVNKDCKCKGLTLETEWFTTSRSGQVTGKGPAATLFSGEWRGEEQNRYPFTLPAPAGPITYDGHLMKVNWRLTARADIPWALDPKAVELFVLKPAPVPNYHAGPGYHAPAPPAPGMSAGVKLIILWSIMLVIGGVAGYFIQEEGRVSGGIFLGLLGGAVLAALFGIGLLRRFLATRRLGVPKVTIDPQVVAPGQPMTFSFGLSPSKPLKLNKVEVAIAAEEKVVYYETYYSQGKTRTRSVTLRHTAFTATPPVQIDQGALASGAPCTLGTVVDIPAAGPCSLALNNHSITWSCSVKFDIEGWPDYVTSYELAVLPTPTMPKPTPVISGDGRIIG